MGGGGSRSGGVGDAARVASLDWRGVCVWLHALDIDTAVVQLVGKEKVY